MTQVQAPPLAWRHRLGWVALLALDVVAGFLAAGPLYFIGTGAAHLLSVRLGLDYRGYWGSEDAGTAFVGGIVLLVPILVVVVAVNEPLRRRMRLPARLHWPVVAALLVLPLLVGYLSSILLR